MSYNIVKILKDIYRELRGKYGGAKNADYISTLKNKDPAIFQISVYPVKGNKWGLANKAVSVGTFKNKKGEPISVTIQSVSKVFNLALAIKKRNKKTKTGIDDISQIIGTEASFMSFNDINAHKMMDGSQGVPFTINPFINSGAIATVSLITSTKTQTPVRQMINNLNDFSGSGYKSDNQPISMADYKKEVQWMRINKKLSKKMKSLSEKFFKKKTNIRKFKYFQGNKDSLNIKSALDNYTSICSVLTDSKKLADMSYTLANGGVNRNGKRILKCKENRYVLSQMAYGGMYNSSGSWFQKYGIPMKSGVGGAIIAVIPGQLAVSVVSPPLDKYGNSELGGKVIELLAEKLKFHMYGFCGNM
jgi:glutaminase